MHLPTRRWLLGATASTCLEVGLGDGLGLVLGVGLATRPAQAASTDIPKHPPLVFARDAGAHPEFKTEWWYLTGWASESGAAAGPVKDGMADAAYGFQITFFRSRVEGTQGMQSRLAARQLLFAHAAITDVKGKRLWHDQRIARWSGEAPGRNPADNASASMQDTGVLLRDWSLLREGPDLHAKLNAEGFAMDLRFSASQAVLLQGDEGLSRKGPDPRQTSYYYSLPQLQASGTLTLQGKPLVVGAGSTAWLDHEWSEEVLSAGAVGWDWIGINLFDGSALTAFRLRDKAGDTLWDGGSFRAASTRYVFSRGEVLFKPLRIWHSPSSRASYPVEWMVRTPADFYTVKAVLDNQELDSRNSTGAIYWEGLCEVWDSNNKKVGRGYLEMTGYAAPLKM